MYDPTVGSWISEDPIGFAGGDANLGRYVGNMPTIFVDPTGLQDTPQPLPPVYDPPIQLPPVDDPPTQQPIIDPSPGLTITIPPSLLDPPKKSPEDLLPPGFFRPGDLPSIFPEGSTLECQIIPKFDWDYDFDDPLRPSIDMRYKQTDIKFIIRY